ncbi:MAG: hypothetical protein ABEJ75_03070 [Candidatus Nanohaloarchaea archaeon]
MEIEAELPEDFDELPAEQKVEELEALLDRTDSAMKSRMLEELIEHYSSP